MKRVILVLCVLVALLTGCSNQDAPETTDTLPVETTETTPQGLLVPDSSVQQQTSGAVNQYNLSGETYSDLLQVGDKLLLLKDGETTELLLLFGVDGIPTARATLETKLGQSFYLPIHSGFVYYLTEQRQVVFLDPQLQESNRITLPDDMQGDPAFSADGGEIYYCVGQEIRGLDTQMQVSRLIKSHGCATQTLLGCYFDSKILVCRATYEDGSEKTLYISTQTGQTLYTYEQIRQLITYSDRYFAIHQDGEVEQVMFGRDGDLPQQLNLDGGSIYPALSQDGVVQCIARENGMMEYSFFDLTSGKRSAAVTLSGISKPDRVFADAHNNIWILATDNTSAQQTLLRWNVKGGAALEEDGIYTGTFYTAQSPDQEGLAECEKRAEELNKTHGVRIRIWEEAVKNPGDHNLEIEYQTVAINRCLDELTKVLEEFPEKFVRNSLSSRVTICIVGSVDQTAEAVQYWDGDNAYIVLSVDCNIREGFIKGFSYIVDSHVLGNTSVYDYWSTLNPEGFSYTDPATHQSSYLTPENRMFVDNASMTSVTEDRSSLFYQAMLPENAEMFQSEGMQAKLKMMCEAIRAAWRWKKKTETYPWEQYLSEPIAYTK